MSEENKERLSKSKQRLINEILPALRHREERGEGFLLGVSPTTLETWEIVEAKLLYLLEQWTAMQTPEALAIPSKEDAAPFVILEWALAREFQIVLLSDKGSGRNIPYERRKFVSQHQVEYGAPELVAYNAVCALHKYAEKWGWTTDEKFGELLGIHEMNEREKIYEKWVADLPKWFYTGSGRPTIFHH